jgi:hypothetical protein
MTARVHQEREQMIVMMMSNAAVLGFSCCVSICDFVIRYIIMY